ncbi:MAG TPA: hypothetical protein VN798_14935, partial [Pseudomonas sp.]|nr:hypothetical protein [Pseudomonas sp.]
MYRLIDVQTDVGQPCAHRCQGNRPVKRSQGAETLTESTQVADPHLLAQFAVGVQREFGIGLHTRAGGIAQMGERVALYGMVIPVDHGQSVRTLTAEQNIQCVVQPALRSALRLSGQGEVRHEPGTIPGLSAAHHQPPFQIVRVIENMEGIDLAGHIEELPTAVFDDAQNVTGHVSGDVQRGDAHAGRWRRFGLQHRQGDRFSSRHARGGHEHLEVFAVEGAAVMIFHSPGDEACLGQRPEIVRPVAPERVHLAGELAFEIQGPECTYRILRQQAYFVGFIENVGVGT